MPEINDVLKDKKTSEPKKKTKKVVTETASTTDVVEATTIEKKESKPEYRRPPIEQITTDFEAYLITLTIDNKPIIKLGYKCGKIIYGLESPKGKNFRIIAFKARKKSKTVTGKSRCIFYFGFNEPKELKNIASNEAITHSKFGKCSVQSKCPIELILDKKTFTEIFEKDASKVLTLLKKLADAAIESKSKQYQDSKKKEKETKDE